MTHPTINVTPLIDVLLVLLIIFMVVTPTKPSSFKARIPQEPDAQQSGVTPDPNALIVVVEHDAGLTLNRETGLGSVDEPQKMTDRLQSIFEARSRNYALPPTEAAGIPRGVFIKAPRGMDYGSVAKVVDAVKSSGADPIALQIDDLN
ncbi:MAG: biopolymer transporter ExbD [Pyrinomonadaceae bacterium]